jgi:hypothetical protein
LARSGEERKVYKVLVGKAVIKRPLGRPRRRCRRMGSEWILRENGWGACGLDTTGSRQGPMSGCCEYGDESSGFLRHGMCLLVS